MLRYDHHPAQQRDALAQRQALLDVLVDYRYLAPASIAARERREQAMERAAIAQAQGQNADGPRWWTTPLRRLRAVLASIGVHVPARPLAGCELRKDARITSAESGAGSHGQFEEAPFTVTRVSQQARRSEVPQP